MIRTLFILSLLALVGCASIRPLTPEENKRLMDEFNRAHENPIPPGLIIPPPRR